MASPLALRTPTCLSCLRRIASPARPAIWTQLRGKKTRSKLVVRLIKDVPGWGPAGNMLSISREAMRTYWYPSGQMRYVTPDEWKHNKYTDEMISSRERSFGIEKEDVEVEEDDFYDPLAEDMARMEASRHTVEVEQLTPSRALELINEYIAATLTFERRPVNPEAAAAALAEAAQTKPSQAPEDGSTDAEAEATTPSAAAASPTQLSGLAARRARHQTAIHGSVSTRDIAQQIRDLMLLDPEAARIQIDAEDVTFVERALERENKDGVTKVEKLGTYEVMIQPHVGKTKLNPIWRTIEVKPFLGEEKAAAEIETTEPAEGEKQEEKA